jgi:hypothetical protein
MTWAGTLAESTAGNKIIRRQNVEILSSYWHRWPRAAPQLAC